MKISPVPIRNNLEFVLYSPIYFSMSLNIHIFIIYNQEQESNIRVK